MALAPYSSLQGSPAPHGGWLRAVRESLGRSLRAQASLLGLSSAALHKSESAEADGRITLGQLRRLAAALDCELVYGLVPRKPLREVVKERARSLAKNEVLGVAYTMGLEDQAPSSRLIERAIDEREQALLSGSWSRLWRR